MTLKLLNSNTTAKRQKREGIREEFNLEFPSSRRPSHLRDFAVACCAISLFVKIPPAAPRALLGKIKTLFRSTSLILLATIAGCHQTARPMDTSQRINAGVEIVPEAVLAAEKMSPKPHDVSSDQLDLIDVINGSDQKHYKLIEALRASGFVPLLQQSGPYTIMAPTDEAFDKLPPGVFDRLLLPAHHQQLVAFLKYHLLTGRITFAQMLETNGQIPTLAGPNVIVKGIDNKAMVNDANVLRSDSTAANGVVHWIDHVLIPPAS